jgi:hypothetical protein
LPSKNQISIKSNDAPRQVAIYKSKSIQQGSSFAYKHAGETHRQIHLKLVDRFIQAWTPDCDRNDAHTPNLW